MNFSLGLTYQDITPFIGVSCLFLFLISLFLLSTLWFFQYDFIYPSNVPPKSTENVALPSQYGLEDFEDVHIKTSDNVIIRGYLLKQNSDSKNSNIDTIVFLHDNSGNMGHRLPVAKALYDTLKVNIFMLSYRGYGLSQGFAHESGIKKDIIAALGYLRSNPLTAKSRLIIYGQSLGGAVAIDTAAEFESEFSGLIVENTFKSIPEMFVFSMPWIKWAKLLISEKWDSEKRIKLIKRTPILFLSGEIDDYVPPEHVKSLYDISCAYSETHVEFHSFKNGRHNNTCTQEGYFECIKDWWTKNIASSKPYSPTNIFSNMVPIPADDADKSKPKSE
ncbi:hypothetical protein BB561_004384 [Smittium simulii]|uniref:Peptidase S9 prolyl oligopeptidase catalytic domain-containing protein n=1 Tax=Smittium simulii TaxID=133385 RepID=A0A2T9YGK7_9FUNG|nr:hypothetical protein BB561_004384 [Smittium simulii]